jgi:transposase InsO family protein
MLCQLLEIPKSTYYYGGNKVDETTLKRELLRVAGQWPTYGARRLSAQMSREGFKIGRMHTARLMEEMGIKAKRKRRKKRTTQSNHDYPRYPNLVLGRKIERIDQVSVDRNC